MDGFGGDNFDQADVDPAAEFLAREKDQLAGIVDDVIPPASEGTGEDATTNSGENVEWFGEEILQFFCCCRRKFKASICFNFFKISFTCTQHLILIYSSCSDRIIQTRFEYPTIVILGVFQY